MGLRNNLTCRKCSTEEETSVHILCEREILASLRHTYLGSFFLDLEDIRNLIIGAIWKFDKGKGLLLVQNMEHKGPVLRLRCIGPGRARTQIPFIQDIYSGKWKLFWKVRSIIRSNLRHLSQEI
jgi:hypothetical protein